MLVMPSGSRTPGLGGRRVRLRHGVTPAHASSRVPTHDAVDRGRRPTVFEGHAVGALRVHVVPGRLTSSSPMLDRWRHGGLLEALLPTTCVVCRIPGNPVCARCLASIGHTAPTACRTCGHPWTADLTSCPECPRGLAGAQHAVPFDEVNGRIVTALKDHGRRDLGEVMARVMVARCAAPSGAAVLVPVPLTHARHRRRGYNQSTVLAEALGRRWSVEVDDGLLARTREAPPQRGSSRTARAAHVRGAFQVVRAGPADPIWLVDDVLTTGATIGACAIALRRAGIRGIRAVTFARVVGVRSERSAEPDVQ